MERLLTLHMKGKKKAPTVISVSGITLKQGSDMMLLVKFAEKAGRYEDMVKFLVQATIQNKGILSIEERKLLA